MSSQISRVQNGTNQALARLQFGPGCIRTLIREHAHAQHHFNCHSCTLRLGSLAKLGPQPQLGLRAFRRLGSLAGDCGHFDADGKNIDQNLHPLRQDRLTPTEPFRGVAGYVLMMTQTSYKIIRPFALAIALLWSAPLFAIFEQTLRSEDTLIAVSTVVLKQNLVRTTVIYKT